MCVLLQVYDISEFETLTGKYEKLNWRIISKPGGATVKPDEYYTLYGCGPFHCQLDGLCSLQQEHACFSPRYD